MQRTTLKKVGIRILQVLLLAVILGFFAYYIARDWKTLTSYTFHWNPWLLLLSFVGFVLQELSYGLIWRTILARLGSKISLRLSLRIYLASEFVRYIPGNVWHVLARILWISKHGVSRPIAFASMTIELITKLAAGALVFALSLLFWSDIGAARSLLHGTFLVPLLGVGIILLLLVGLHPRLLNGLLNKALRLLKRDPVILTLRYADILLVTLAWCASWLVAGCAFYVMLLALIPSIPLAALPICIGIYALAWDIGFLSFITPSGLGFREGAIAILLSLALPSLPLAVGPIIAVLSRFVSTLAELLCVSIAYLSGGRQASLIQQEEASLASPATVGISPLSSRGEVGESVADVPLPETSASISLERGGAGD